MKINPAILTSNIVVFSQQLELIKQQAEIEVLQVDVIDALFADNITITPSDLSAANLDFNDLLIDFHLMTEEPMDYVWELQECGLQLPTSLVIGQIEKMSHQPDFLEEVKKANWRAGLALDLFTPIESIEDDAWEWLDHVLLMAVEAGEQAQQFNPLVLKKIKELKNLAINLNHPVEISVDGGIKPKYLKKLNNLGVDGVAVGSFLFASDDFNLAFEDLKKETL